MEHGFDLMGANRMTNRVIIPDIARHEGPPPHEALVPGRKIVEDDWSKARAAQRFAGMRTHIAGATGDEDGTGAHDDLPSLLIILNALLRSWSLNGRGRLRLGYKPFKIGNSLGQSFSERDGGTPAKHPLGLADVWPSFLRIILRKGSVYDFGA